MIWPFHEKFIATSYDLEADYRSVIDGDFDNASMVITNYSVMDPGCAPEGGIGTRRHDAGALGVR